MCGKGQSSVEYMVLVGAITIVFIALQVYTFTKYNEAGVEESRARMREVCDSVSSQLTLAGYSKNYSDSFVIPYSGAGLDFSVAVYDDTLVLDYFGQSCIGTFRAGALRYNNSGPPFTLKSGTYRINNTGGVVYIAPQ